MFKVTNFDDTNEGANVLNSKRKYKRKNRRYKNPWKKTRVWIFKYSLRINKINIDTN